MPQPVEVGFRATGPVEQQDTLAERIAHLAAFELQHRYGRAEFWRVVRVETRGGEHFYRFEVQTGGFGARSRVKSDLLGILEELSSETETTLADRQAKAVADGFAVQPLVREVDPTWKRSGGSQAPAEAPLPDLTGSQIYRQERSRSQAAMRYTALLVVALALIVGAALLWTPLHPAPPQPTKSKGGGSGPSGTVTITLGKPTLANVTCGNGASVELETVPWVRATSTLTTGDLVMEIRELADGDVVGGPTTPPDVTGTNDCAGSPPSGGLAWYAVLANPAGTNIATFSYSQSWSPVGGAPPSPTVAAGSSITLLVVPSVANHGYGLFVYGSINGPNVAGSVTL